MQFSIENVNKAGSVVNVERLRWINSRHVRALFTPESVTEEHKASVVGTVLPFISSSLAAAKLPSSTEELVAEFGVNYIWRAMDLMKVRQPLIQATGENHEGSNADAINCGCLHREGTSECAPGVRTLVRSVLHEPGLDERGSGADACQVH
jgi:hypothetical protein